jgi:hypothetical protein
MLGRHAAGDCAFRKYLRLTPIPLLTRPVTEMVGEEDEWCPPLVIEVSTPLGDSQIVAAETYDAVRMRQGLAKSQVKPKLLS